MTHLGCIWIEFNLMKKIIKFIFKESIQGHWRKGDRTDQRQRVDERKNPDIPEGAWRLEARTSRLGKGEYHANELFVRV